MPGALGDAAVVPSTAILDGLDVHRQRQPRNGACRLLLHGVREVVRPRHGPVPRDEEVHRSEGPRPGLTRAERVPHEPLRRVRVQDCLEPREIVCPQARVEEPAGRPRDEPRARAEDERSDDQRDERIEHEDPRRTNGGHADDHADRRPHVREQVVTVRLERQRPPATPHANEQDAHDEVDEGRSGRDRQAEHDVVERLRPHEPRDGRSDDREGCREDERTLERTREQLDLVVPEGVLLVGRRLGRAQRDERDDGGDEVHARLEGVREQADGAGERPRDRLQPDREHRRRDRQPRVARERRGGGGHGLAVRQPGRGAE